MPYCHATPDPSCPICQRYLADPVFRAIIDEVPAFKAKAVSVQKTAKVELPCVHLGEHTGETVLCATCCGGSVKLKTFVCAVHGTCTITKRVPDVPGCCDSKCEQKLTKRK